MIQAGSNITQKDDLLKKIPIDYLFNSIRNPKSEISSLIRQVRMVRTLDMKQYNVIKKRLPYFVCGIFNPPYRRTENFAYTRYFILDVDKISEKNLSISSLKEIIQKDNRVMLCFISPGEDGLKIMYRLKEKCYDSGLYSLFYKTFAKKVAVDYHIDQVIDLQTSDVCRACFISSDPEIYYNQNAESVDLNSYIDTDNPFEMFQLKSELSSTKPVTPDIVKNEADKSIDPDKEVISRIKGILNPSLTNKIAPPPIYVPEQLEEIMTDLEKYIEGTGVIITDVINIQYGKKLRFKTGLKQAEINVFYGKRGFSVVLSPKSGTSEEFNKLMAELIKNFINENYLI